MGLGPGSFIVAIAAVIGLVIIFLRHSVQTPNLMVLAGFALPLIVLGILRSLPIQPLKSELNAQASEPRSWYLFRTALICSIIYATALVLCMMICCSGFTN